LILIFNPFNYAYKQRDDIKCKDSHLIRIVEMFELCSICRRIAQRATSLSNSANNTIFIKIVVIFSILDT